MSLERFREEFELPVTNFYNRYIPNVSRKDINEAFIEAIFSVGEPKPFSEAEKFLEALHKEGIRMALLSSHVQKKIEQEMKDYGFSKFFVKIKGSVHDKRETILDLIKKCNFKKEETVFIGDMTHDIETGKMANVRTIAVTWGYDSKEKLKKAEPDYIVDSFEELKELILKNPKV